MEIAKRIDHNSLESLKCFIPIDELMLEIHDI